MSLPDEGQAPPNDKAEKKKGKKKDKVRSAWIAFVGRILAQVIGAAATVALGIFVATRMQSRPVDPAPVPSPPRPAAPARAPGTVAIAVLPLENLSGDAKQEYFADGMTDALITDLAQIGGARVISRTSSMSYKGQRKPLPQIAEELGVDFIVEGSVMRAGDRVRITAQLIDARKDEHVWARTYDHRVRDVFALQGEVATQIAAEVKGALTPSQRTRLAQRKPIDPAVYDLYLRGRYAWNLRTPEGYRDAIRAFEEAIGKDPDFALAHAGLADTYSLQTTGGDRRQATTRAKPAALRALELDAGLAEAHTALAAVYHRGEGRRDEAEREFRQALLLNPGYATAHQWYSIFLAEDGRDEEALNHARQAVLLDPLSGTLHMTLGLIQYYGRRYAESEAEERRALELGPQLEMARLFLARTLVAAARPAAAIALYGQEPPKGAEAIAALAAAHRLSGDAGRADALVKRLRAMDPLPAAALARFHAVTGERAAALDMLERAADMEPTSLQALMRDPAFDALRSDARFAAAVRRAKRG